MTDARVPVVPEALKRAWSGTPQWSHAILGGVAAIVAGTAVANLAGLDTPDYVLLLGGLNGLGYGLLAVCLVLVFRTSQVVNFAQPGIGLVAAACLPKLQQLVLLPYWVVFVLVLAIGGALSALVDLVVVRRLRTAPRAVAVTALIGCGVTLVTQSRQLLTGDSMPTPPGLPEFHLGPLVVSPASTALIIAAPVLVTALTIFMTRTRFGLAIRAAASNRDAACLAGISPRAMTALAWACAGVCGTVFAVFTASVGSTSSDVSTGSLFASSGIVPALAAAAIAGMSNFPRAMVSGIVLGVMQQILLWSPRYASDDDLILFAATLLILLLLPAARGRREAAGSWAALPRARALPEQLARLWSVRAIPLIAGLAVLAVLVWRLAGNASATVLAPTLIGGAIIALSAGMIMAIGGDLSLGQYAIAGLGGAAAFLVIDATGAPLLGLLVAAIVGGLACALLAYPALRVGGLTLTVLTISLSVAIPTDVLPLSGLFGLGGKSIGQPVFFGYPLNIGRPYLWWSLGLAAVCALVAYNVWRGGFGRLALAVRDNRLAARSFGIKPMRVHMQLFFVAGMLAAVGGVVLLQAAPIIAADAYPPDNGALIVLAVVLGGTTIFSGSLIGVVWVLGIPLYFVDTSGGVAAAAYSTALVLILIAPGGAGQLLVPVRDALAIGLGRLHGVHVTWNQLHTATRTAAQAPEANPRPITAQASVFPALRPAAHAPRPGPGPLLDVRDIVVDFGGVHAVRQASFSVMTGEILGLIGPNGAGKTTTFEVLSGFVAPKAGQVCYAGVNITAVPTERRVGMGLVRSFQNASLFPTMTVLDVIALSLEQQAHTRVALSVLGLDRGARRRRAVAGELVSLFGLGHFARKTIAEVSTGTRRVVELACIAALQPRLVLLDEPSSGIAQREVEALAGVIKRFHTEFDMTMVIIEHDIPLITALSDRIVAMVAGEVVACDAPDVVLRNSMVVDSYLGHTAEAINRSGVLRTVRGHR